MSWPERILMIHNHYRGGSPSGENRSFEEEARVLTDAGHHVIRYERASDEIEGWSTARRAGLAARATWSGEDRRRLRALLERERPEVAHVQNTFPLISPAVLGVCRDAGLPVVQAIRNYRFACVDATLFRDGAPCVDCLGRSPLRGVARGCYRGSRAASASVGAMMMAHRALGTWQRDVDLFAVPSEHVRRRLGEAGIDPARVVVKPNVVAPDPGLSRADRTSILYAGRLTPEKGIGTLLAAARSLDGTVPITVAGDGPLAAGVRDAAGVRWLGPCTPEQVRTLMAQARAVVVPSIWEEPFGRTVAEAFACGTPVVASDIGGLGELVEHGVTGFLAAPGDADALARALEKMWSGGDAAEMGRAARARYEQRYAAVPQHRALLALYRRAREVHR